MTERLHFHFSLRCIGEGNGNPLQCSCLENPRDGGAWWAAVCRVVQSRTRLTRLSSSSSSSRHLRSCIICKYFLSFSRLSFHSVDTFLLIHKLIGYSFLKNIYSLIFNFVCAGSSLLYGLFTRCDAAAAKLLQSCLTLCDPIDGSPSGSLVPGILQARTLEWAAISFSNAWK